MVSAVSLLVEVLLFTPLNLCDWVLGLMMTGYDKLCYSPLQVLFTPLMEAIPRYLVLQGKTFTVFTPNGVTWSRTVLVVPVAWCLKTGHFTSACLLIVLHDFLDHLDGIVAKAQKKVYGAVNNPLLGGFMDAFCDKVVNVLSLWSILLLADYTLLSTAQTLVFLGVAAATISYEVALGVIRVQDYYYTKYSRTHGSKGASVATAAVMAGKLKEKLESVGLAFLCLALGTQNPVGSWAGIAGLACFAISLRFAHSSLMHKLAARRKLSHISSSSSSSMKGINSGCNGTVSSLSLSPNPREKAHMATQKNGLMQHVTSMPELPSFTISSDSGSSSSDHDEEEVEPGGGANGKGNKVDKVYTVGCFDLFHRGHINLLRSMRKLGREVIVGVHSDESYVKLKQKCTIDNTEKRMSNVKKYADQVFVVWSTDPSPFIRCCVHLNPGEDALYVRGDDMPHFPGRSVAEELMPIKLLPYTQGVSSTMLRAQLLAGRNGEE